MLSNDNLELATQQLVNQLEQWYPSIKGIELRDGLIAHACNNKLFPALHETYDQDILNELVNMGVASKSEIIYASTQTVNYQNINDVLETVNNIKNINFFAECDEIINADYAPAVLLLHSKQLLQLAKQCKNFSLYKIKENDTLIYGFSRCSYLSMDVINHILKYFSIYNYTNIITLSGDMSINGSNDTYLLKPISYEWATVRSDIAVKKQIGKYYYEFVIKDIGPVHPILPKCDKGYWTGAHFGRIGWADGAWLRNSKKDGIAIAVGDDSHSWAFDGGGDSSKWHCRHSDKSYGKCWHHNDVVGCGINVHAGNIFDVIFYLNGECLGIAWENCKYEGNLYAAFATRDADQYCANGTMVFGEEKFKFMPDEYQPIFTRV